MFQLCLKIALCLTILRRRQLRFLLFIQPKVGLATRVVDNYHIQLPAGVLLSCIVSWTRSTHWLGQVRDWFGQVMSKRNGVGVWFMSRPLKGLGLWYGKRRENKRFSCFFFASGQVWRGKVVQRDRNLQIKKARAMRVLKKVSRRRRRKVMSFWQRELPADRLGWDLCGFEGWDNGDDDRCVIMMMIWLF